MINNMLVEAIVATGLRRKPVFRWSAIANDLKTVIGSIAQGEVVIPNLSGDETKMNRDIGLVFIVANIHERSDKTFWPDTGLRRQATIALQMGFEIAKAVENYPYFAEGIAEYLDFAFTAEADKEEISVYGLCLVTALMSYLTENSANRQPTGICEKYCEVVQRNQFREQLVTEITVNLKNPPEEIGTAFFASIATAMFGDQGEKYPPTNQAEAGTQAEQDGQNQETEDGGQATQDDRKQAAAEGTQAEQDGQNQETGDGGQATQDDQKQAAAEGTQAEQGGQNQETEDSGQAEESPQAPGNEGANAADQVELDEPTEVDAQVPESEQTQTTENDCPLNNDADDKANTLVEVDLFGAADDVEESQVSCLVGIGAGGADGSEKSKLKPVQIEGRINGLLVPTIIKLFQAVEEQPTGLCKSGSKVSIKHAWRMRALGDTRIFKKKREDPGVDMAMSILVDRSESMERLLKQVCDTAYTFALGLTRVPGAKSRLAAFPAFGPEPTTTLLDFGEHTKRAEERLSMLYASGSTPLAQAIAAETDRLLAVNEPRKVITVLTDGVPDNGPQVKSCILRAERLGVEVIGIGFGAAAGIKSWIAKSEYISDVDELPDALVSIYEQMLVSQH